MVQRIGRQPGQWISTGQNLAPASLVRVMPSPADWQGSSSKWRGQGSATAHLHLLNPHLTHQRHSAAQHAQQGQCYSNHGSATGSGLGSSCSAAGLVLAENSSQAEITACSMAVRG